MGRAVGLRIEKVAGYGKGFSYAEGVPPKGTNHAWNAVWLDNKWHLLDATWDAGAVDRRTRQFVRNTKDFQYFLGDPGYFITSHFPSDARWQLQDRRIDFAEFLSFARIPPDISFWGIDISKHRHRQIDTSVMPYVFDFGEQTPKLTATLHQEGQKVDGTWALQVRTDHQIKLLVAAPRPGKYDLIIYAAKNPSDRVNQSILEYKVDFQDSARLAKGFPLPFSSYFESRAQLIKPLEGVLPSVSEIRFELRLEGARNVALFQNGKLLRTLNRNGTLFTGDVTPSKGELHVFAMLGTDNRYSGILRYEVE
jgi:hypothetical protein